MREAAGGIIGTGFGAVAGLLAFDVLNRMGVFPAGEHGQASVLPRSMGYMLTLAVAGSLLGGLVGALVAWYSKEPRG